jgi:RNA polymerase sigma-70 factor (ECF subfamily)
MSYLPIHNGMDERESALIERLQRRDPTALGMVYDLYGRRVYSLIVRMVKNAGTAEDLVQETFLRVWISADRIDVKRGALGGWLLTIARNRTVDYLRSSRDRRNCNFSTLRKSTHREMEDPKLFDDLERSIWTSDNMKRLCGALDRLRVNERKLINLVYFEHNSQTEIASKLGLPLGTVKGCVRRALRILREDFRRGPVFGRLSNGPRVEQSNGFF